MSLTEWVDQVVLDGRLSGAQKSLLLDVAHRLIAETRCESRARVALSREMLSHLNELTAVLSDCEKTC